MENHANTNSKSFWKHPVTLLCLAGVGYWIYTYHWQHTLGFLPYIILLLCPLMHIFGHGKHGHSHAGSQPGQSKNSKGGHDHAR